jgi:hypothetical protein
MGTFTFKQGFTYIAGVDAPGGLNPLALISDETIIAEIEKMGFRVLLLADCEDYGGGRFPFHTPGTCGDEWDRIGIAVRTGPTQAIEVDSRVKWIQEVEQAAPAPVPGQPAPQPTAPTQPSAWIPMAHTYEDEPERAAMGAGGWLVAAVVGGIAGIFAVRWLSKG